MLSSRFWLVVAALVAAITGPVSAAPISTYPIATSPLSGSEKLVGTQGSATVNVTPAQINTYAGLNLTATGSISGEQAQTLKQLLDAGPANVFWFLTSAQQAAVLNNTSAVDFRTVFDAIIASYSSVGSKGYDGAGPQIQLPCGSYPMAGEWIPQKTFMLTGSGGAGGQAGAASCSLLKFGTNVRGIFFRTRYTSPPQTGSGGSVLSNLSIEDSGSSTFTTDPISHSAIEMNARVTLQNININWSGGSGLYIHATFGDGSDPAGGNANEYSLDTLNIIAAGYCVYTSGADVNAASEIKVGCNQSGLAGYADLGFLGGSKVAYHADHSGARGQGVVAYSGNLYHCISFSLCPSTTPGTDSGAWYDAGAGTGYPTWTLNNPYFPSGGINNNPTNGNNRSVWTNPYIEAASNGFSNVRTPSMVIGGNLCNYFTSTSVCIESLNGIGGGTISARTGMGGYKPLAAGDALGAYKFSYAAPEGLQAGCQNCQAWLLGWTSPYLWGVTIANLDQPITGTAATTSGTPTWRDAAGIRSGVWIGDEGTKGGFFVGPNGSQLRLSSTAANPATTGKGPGSRYFTTGPTPAGVGAYVVQTTGTPDTIFADYNYPRADPSTGIGYVTGAGGTVTQGTSRTTTVVLSKISGDVVWFSAAGSATPFTFTVTNTTVGASDTISVSMKGATTDVYRCDPTVPAAGSFTLTCVDLTGTATEAPTVHFNVIKGAISLRSPANDNAAMQEAA